jgi:hypothetical protein
LYAYLSLIEAAARLRRISPAAPDWIATLFVQNGDPLICIRANTCGGDGYGYGCANHCNFIHKCILCDSQDHGMFQWHRDQDGATRIFRCGEYRLYRAEFEAMRAPNGWTMFGAPIQEYHIQELFAPQMDSTLNRLVVEMQVDILARRIELWSQEELSETARARGVAEYREHELFNMVYNLLPADARALVTPPGAAAPAPPRAAAAARAEDTAGDDEYGDEDFPELSYALDRGTLLFCRKRSLRYESGKRN